MYRPALLAVGLAGCFTVGEAGPQPGVDSAPGTDTPTGGGGGSLHITATSSVSPGNATYAPRNITAVWIEDAAGTFIKTIDRQANARKASLVAWVAKAGTADTDAVTGATRANHTTPLSITWDLKDKTGAVIADGMYTVRMESADENAAQPTDNNQGTFTFMKSATAQNQPGLSNGGFSAVTLDFTP